jgi:RNA polymerase-associated protein RTF1
VGAAAVCGANPSLDSLPEIERENILAARQEEIQKFKDAAQLDAMYKMAAGQDEDEDDYTPRKQREGD